MYYNQDGNWIKQIDFAPYFGDKKIMKASYDEDDNRIKTKTKITDNSGNVIDTYS